jgi:hypothetical protein
VLQETLLQLSCVAFDTFGLLKLEPSAGGVFELGGKMAKGTPVGNFKPNGVVVTKEFIDGQVASTHWNQVGGAKNAIHGSLLLFCLVGCGGEVLRGIEFKNHVVHVIVQEHLWEASISELHVEVTTHYDLVT